ncbi:MAG TPA: PfkB family carbohydrate kinase, partial [Lacipirellula sp.]
GPITAEELGEFEGALAEAAAVATGVLLIGSLPHGAPKNYFRQLLTHVRCPVILDIRGPELLAALEDRPTVIKPNREEIEQTLGALIRTDEHMRDAVAELQRRGARGVVATSGAGDVWVAVGPEIHCISPPSIAAVVNPIGCGDCVAAGIAWGLANGGDLIAAVDIGLQTAAKNLQTLLPSDFDGRREQLARR